MTILRKIGSFFLDIFETVIIALSVFVLMYLFLFQPHQVKGKSMFPNFHDNEYILTDKISFQFGEPARGDVVIFKAPGNEDYDYIKRIIALPGETIRIQSGEVYVNSEHLFEPYLPEELSTKAGGFLREGQTFTVPENQYLVMGDNRNYSSDSRSWGAVPQENIIGKAWIRYWPVSEAGIIPKQEYLP